MPWYNNNTLLINGYGDLDYQAPLCISDGNQRKETSCV